MRSFFEGFMLSICFFTRIPALYHVKKLTDKTYKFLALTIPINGLILALITILFYHLLSTSHQMYVAILASVFYLFMYGFLHLEAVADITDAYYAKHGGKDSYEILKDCHVGAVGAILTFSFLIVKVAALSYLLIEGDYLGIVTILFLSRMMALLAIYRFDFHEDSTFIHAMKKPLDKLSMILFAVFSLIVLLSLNHLLLLAPALIITLLIKIWLTKYIGFLNGDGLGFIIEINELILLNLLIFI
jgi:adenosylcobinamide-GDP ribazoletransferase